MLPHTEHEWVFYHVRGMFELRSGNLEEATRIFQDGLTRSPYFRIRNIFRSALALAEIKAKNFTRATQLLDGADEPLQMVILSIGYALSGDGSSARSSVNALNDNVPPKILALKLATIARADNRDAKSDQWFIAAGEEAILQMAA